MTMRLALALAACWLACLTAACFNLAHEAIACRHEQPWSCALVVVTAAFFVAASVVELGRLQGRWRPCSRGRNR